ncbi:hypothetical protein NEUTE1DRAFT_75157 [Neurospora tetrasperma FGSC 2508]|uniref:Uncharacterized protein n=1 Tax=Neurospora tetrasperma (strain FGSC 2508 / ATCC MYA-4615 / P0657) TaxID=510951 RepID=F8MBF5_NEUT8|nr:uncharacterized protein NEUTE1DRAFT_75157 [Neurospora tetrasperma FGSC 2508]EGO60267.1 hypothetical protein NEUTE1DRAFT_75157 [Neurospora tetrasperma FGSC 2508]EGZ75769.1 hypothetical protein NEUTE2DRAFT_84568 [Neurospora tetrasperma FGSC 2509]
MSKEPRESSRHRQPHKRDSLTSVLSWAGLQPRSSPTKTPSTSSSEPAPTSPSHHGLSRGRRHSSSTDDKKKARRRSMALRRFSISVPGAAAVDEDSLTKAKLKKTPSWTLDNKASESAPRTTTKAASTDAINKTTTSASTNSDQNTSEVKEEASNGDHSEEKASKEKLPGHSPQQQQPLPPPPKPKSILRVASPDGRKPPPRKIPCFSTTLPEYDPRKPTADHACLVPLPDSSITSITGSVSSSESSICRPERHGTATVRFATATVHRVEVGPGRRFLPVKRKSKSTVTYISRFDDENSLKKNLTSPTKQRRHRANQAAMGRYWQRTEEEEALEREEARKRAEQEAEQYRAEPSSHPDPDFISKSGTTPPSPELAATDDKLEEIYVDDEKPESDSPRKARRDASPASYRSSSLHLVLPAPEPDTGFPCDDLTLEEELEAQQEDYKTELAHIGFKTEAAETRDWPLAELEAEPAHQEVQTLLEIKTPRGIVLSPIAEEFAIDDEEEDSESGGESDHKPMETTKINSNYQEPEEHIPTMPPTPPRQSTALLLSVEPEQTTAHEDFTDDTDDTSSPSLLTPESQDHQSQEKWSSPRLRSVISSKRHNTHTSTHHLHGKHHSPPSPPASPPLAATKPATPPKKLHHHPSPKLPAFTIPILIPKITIGEKDDNHKRSSSSSWVHRRSSSSSTSSSSSAASEKDKRSGSPIGRKGSSSSDRDSSPGRSGNRLHLSGRRRKSSGSGSGSGSGSHHGHQGVHTSKQSIAV